MLEHNYVPLNPVQTQAFNEAAKRFPNEITPVLSMADALQDATWLAIKKTGASEVEVVMSQVEVALGMGSKAAVTAVKMAGFTQDEDGRWYARVAEGNEWAVLEVKNSFLVDHYKSLSTIH